MIPYVEVIGKYNVSQGAFALVEPTQCWFELSYYNLGEFEVYAPATINNLNALKMGNYVKLPNRPYLWIIKSVEYTYNANGAKMIDVKGYEAKWIISQRIILAPTQLSTDLATAVYSLVYKNVGAAALSARSVSYFVVNRPTFSVTIDQTQATRENLWDFLQKLLKASNCGSYCTYENNRITYQAIQGVDRTDSVIFSQSNDNLISSTYFENSANKRTYCRVVSTFSENDVDTEYVQDYNAGGQNIDRYEMVVNSNISTKLYDEDGNPVIDPTTGKQVNIDPSSAQYQSWQQQEGKNQLSEKIIVKEFNAEIDLKHSGYEFEKDFFIGDLVTCRDEYFGYEAQARITKYTFKLDQNGYGEQAEYGNE